MKQSRHCIQKKTMLFLVKKFTKLISRKFLPCQEKKTTNSRKNQSMEDKNGNNYLKLFREAIGLSQSALAKSLCIPDHRIKSIETGKVKMPTDIALSLEEKFNLNFRWIFTGDGKMFNDKNKTDDLLEEKFDDDYAINNLLKMSKKILKSGKLHAKALENNIIFYDKTLNDSIEFENVKKDINNINNKIDLLSELLIKIKK